MVRLFLNLKKCKVVSFFRSHKMISFDYLIHNKCLLRVEQMEDLGLKLVLSLSFNNHIEFINVKLYVP